MSQKVRVQKPAGGAAAAKVRAKRVRKAEEQDAQLAGVSADAHGAVARHAVDIVSANGADGDSNGGLGSAALLLGGLVAVGGVAAAVGGGGGDKNVAPTLGAIVDLTTKEDTAVSGKAAASDTAGDRLTYSAGAAANGSVSIDSATGAFNYTPKANYSGSDSFTVTVTDAAGLTASQTVKVVVSAENDKPVFAAASQAVATDEDAAKAVTLAATDVDGDAIAYTAANGANGTVQVSGSTATYTPNANFNGTDSFVVTASDGNGGTATQTINVTVGGVNDKPVFAAASQAVATDEDAAKAVTLAATDVDGDAITYTAANGANGTVQVSGSTATYTPNANFNGTDSFVVTASDGNGGTATQTINVTVAPVADSIDVVDDTVAVTYAATAGVIDKFTDVSTAKTNAIITGMTAEDQIEVTGTSDDYSFSSVGNDIVISYNKNGIINQMTLVGLAANGGIITDEATAEATAGFNFFNALTQPSGNGSGDGIAGANGNLDDDNDANPLTTATITATSGADAFTEDALVANTARVVGFGAGDTITVSGATTSAYSFSSKGTDLEITYNNAGVVNTIVLANVISSGTFVGSELSELDAETALGRDFFKDATSGTPRSSSLDVGDATARVSLSGANGPVTFTESASVGSNVVISNFGIDDIIRVNGPDNYYYTAFDIDKDGAADDLWIVYNNEVAGVNNDIHILNVVNPLDFVHDKDSAVSAVGFNFITFG